MKITNELKKELVEYAKIKSELFQKRGFGGRLEVAVDFAVKDMINELKQNAMNKVDYLRSENEYLKECLAKR